MRRMKIMNAIVMLCLLASSLLTGCSDSSDSVSGGDVNGNNPAATKAITTPSADGNAQATIGGVTINSPPVVTFALSDENGQPLDPSDMIKANTSNRLRFFIGRLDANGDFRSYIRDSNGLPTYENGATAGTLSKVDGKPGVYTYTFKTDVKAVSQMPFDATKTHMVTIQLLRKATKNNKAFDQIINPYFNFRPDGVKIDAKRELVAISGCNQCHGKIAAHGSRIDIPMCISCHNPDLVVDGASLDFKVMIHKIHMGKKLPSKSYFSNMTTMGYPVYSADPMINFAPVDCSKCHLRGTDISGNAFGPESASTDPVVAANGAKWKKASIGNCTTCHDTTAFAGETTLTLKGFDSYAGTVSTFTKTATAHTAGTADDTQCVGCHAATGTEYDGTSVTGAHTVWEKSAVRPGLVSKVLYATNVGPGKYPRVYFQLTDSKGKAVAVDAGSAKPNATGANYSWIANNSITVHMAIKPKNVPDFLNARLATDLDNNRFGLYGEGGGSGSTVTVGANVAAYVRSITATPNPEVDGSLGVLDANRGIYFVNFSTARGSLTLPAGSSTPTVPAAAPSKLPKLTGDYLNGATIAFGVLANRSDASIKHRGVTTQLGNSSTIASILFPASITPTTPYTASNVASYQDNVALTYYDLANGTAATSDQQRRVVVDNAKCKTCHNLTPPHNGRQAEACILCHNPNRNDENFSFLIHRYHTGNEMRAGSFRRELTTGISGGRANQIGFPGDRLRCLACHVEENPTPVMSYPAWTKFNMFYGDTSTGGRIPTFAAACLGCHDTAAKAGAPVAHVKSMSPGFAYVPPTAGAPATWVSNEKCTDCHSDAVRKLGHQLPN